MDAIGRELEEEGAIMGEAAWCEGTIVVAMVLERSMGVLMVDGSVDGDEGRIETGWMVLDDAAVESACCCCFWCGCGGGIMADTAEGDGDAGLLGGGRMSPG